MRRVVSALPWVFLAAGLGVAGWIGWDALDSYRGQHETAAVDTSSTSEVMATTTSTTTTTAPPTTTTTTTLPFFSWNGGPAPLGLVDDGPFGSPHFRYALASGVVREVVREEIRVSGVGYQGWVAYFYFGDHPVTGDEVVGRVLLGLDDEANPWPGGTDFVACFRIEGALPPGDPMSSGGFPGIPCSSDLAGEVAGLLQVGRQYPVPLLITVYLGEVPSFFTDQYEQAVEGGRAILAALRGEAIDLADGYARVLGVYLPAPAACAEDDPGCGGPVQTTTTFPRPAGWYESCEAVVSGLIDESLAMMRETAALGAAVDAAQAGTAPWAVVQHTARTWLVPRLEGLIASAEEVIAAEPDTVSRIAAEAFRDAAQPLLNQAVHMVTSLVMPYPGAVDSAAWDPWWFGWRNAVQTFNNVLSRAPATAYNCPD